MRPLEPKREKLIIKNGKYQKYRKEKNNEQMKVIMRKKNS